jgi:hypothetical protein
MSLPVYKIHGNFLDSSVFCTFLDASKAIKGMHYCELLELLITRKLPACIITELIN